MDTVQVDIKDLIPNEKNPRKITQAELKKLARSIQEFGFVEPILVNKHKDRYNIIIGGHQRVQAAKKLGMKQVPVVYVELDEAKEHLLNIALNEISGEWDDDKLYLLLKELQSKKADLTLTGFDEPIIDEIMRNTRNLEREKDIDKTPPVPDKSKSKQGEIYILGDHRLMIGDSTDPAQFEKLMNKKKADLCWTDPPYGVSYKGTNNPNGKDWGVMKNDELREDDLYKLLLAAYTNVAKHTKKNPALYSCYASINHIIFEHALNEAGFLIKQQLIWEKGHVLGHSDYHWSHEPILYCKKKGENPEWFGDRTHKTVVLNSTIEQLEDMKKEQLIKVISEIREASDLHKISKDPTTEYLHATQKPVDLSRKHIKNSSRPQELILEPFGGSGSVMIACESTGRRCYTMELDPKYGDVILTRWATFTGKDPVRESDGAKWSEIKK